MRKRERSKVKSEDALGMEGRENAVLPGPYTGVSKRGRRVTTSLAEAYSQRRLLNFPHLCLVKASERHHATYKNKKIANEQGCRFREPGIECRTRKSNSTRDLPPLHLGHPAGTPTSSPSCGATRGRFRERSLSYH
jgi:hypothetical protein